MSVSKNVWPKDEGGRGKGREGERQKGRGEERRKEGKKMREGGRARKKTQKLFVQLGTYTYGFNRGFSILQINFYKTFFSLGFQDSM